MATSTETEHRRITILRYLDAAPSRAANASMILDVVRDYGVPSTSDQVQTTLAWLDEQELVTLALAGDVTVAQITARGIEVAQGQVVHPGVKRPTPR